MRRFCAGRRHAHALHVAAVAAINARRVPPSLQEELLGAVNALAAAISCKPPQADPAAASDARALAEWLRARSRS